MSPKSDSCLERLDLCKVVVETIRLKYIAKTDSDAARKRKSDNLEGLGLALAKALEEETAAEEALRKHTKWHNCK